MDKKEKINEAYSKFYNAVYSFANNWKEIKKEFINIIENSKFIKDDDQAKAIQNLLN